MQFQRDAEHQWHVERVVVGFERPRRRAAGALLKRGAFDLEVAPRREHAADRLHDPASRHEAVADAFAVDEIEIPHPLSQVGIDEAVILVGGRFQ